MRILVTGGLGYLGCVLTRKALDQGHQVTVLDKGLFSSPLVAKHIVGAEVLEAEVVGMDARDWSAYDFDWALHCAAVSNDPSSELDEASTCRVNVDGTRDVARFCATRGIGMVQASTASCYGLAEWTLSTEESPVNPISIYGRSKVEAEKALRQMARNKGLHCIILRQATLFGWSPRMRFDLVVNTFVASALTTGKIVAQGSGECFRPLLEVGDAADCWLKVVGMADDDFFLEWGGPDFDWCPTFNLVHKNYRISELALWVGDLLREQGIACEVIIDRKTSVDRRNYAMSAERAESIGLTCPTGVAKAVREILEHVAHWDLAELNHPRYRNHSWLTILREAKTKAKQWETIP